MIQKMMNELGEAVEEVIFAQLKLKKAENNAQKVFEKLKDKKMLPIFDRGTSKRKKTRKKDWKSLRSSKTRRCFPFLTEAQAKERRKGRKTESVLDNIRVIASIYNAVQFIYRSKSLQELFLLSASLFLFFDFHNLSISFLHLSQDRDSHQLTTSS